MRKVRLFALVMVLLLVAVFAGGCGSNKDAEDKTGGVTDNSASQQPISFTAAVTAPAEHPAGKSITKFAELVEQKSNGRIKVQTALGGVMGSEREMTEALQLGNLQVGFISDIGMAAVIPEIAFVNLPYLFTDYDQVKELYYNGWIGEEVSKLTLNKGVRILSFADNGFRGLSNSKRPIVGPDDLKGLKIRVPEFPMLLKFFEKLGAAPTPMAITELLTALQQKTVDGQDNGPTL
ncbi:MAG: TRAP transporter substrate-binding protein, partial [Bacillota bacterium]